jgi:hypothetical protein
LSELMLEVVQMFVLLENMLILKTALQTAEK